MQKEICADLHDRKHRRLRRLAHNSPVSLCFCPLQFCFVFIALVLPVAFRLCPVIANGIRQNAVVLETLGGEHGQLLQQFVRVALNARPLHHGVVGLCLLDHFLIGAVHRFPIGRAACRLRAFKLGRVVLHVSLAAFPQGCHRHFVHPVDPAGQPVRQLVHALFRQCFLLANAGKLAVLAAALAPVQQHVSVFFDLRFQRCPRLGRKVLHKGYHCRHGVAAQYGRCCGQACRLRNGNARVQRQHCACIVPAQVSQYFVKGAGPLALGGLQVGQQIIDVAHRILAPLFLDDAVLQVCKPFPRLHAAVQDLLHVPDGRGQARIRRRVPQAALHHICAFFQQNGLSALHAVLQETASLNGRVQIQAVDLGRQHRFIHRNGVVVFHGCPLVAHQLQARLVDELRGVVVEELLHVRAPCPVIVSHGRFHRLQDAIRCRGPVRIRQHSQMYGLPLLVSLLNVTLVVQLCIRNHKSAVHQVVQAVGVVQVHVQTAQLCMGQFGFLSLHIGQAHVHKVCARACKVLHFLHMFFSGHVGKQLFAFHGDLRLPVLAVVQHLGHLFHLAVLRIAAQHTEHPLRAQHIQLIFCQQIVHAVQLSAGVVALAGIHLAGCAFCDCAHFFSLCKTHRLVCIADHMQRRAGNSLQHPHLIHRHGQIGAVLRLLDAFAQPFLQCPCFLAVR